MTDPMDRIADALELMALRSTRDEWYEGGVLRPEYRTVSHLALTLLSNIETRRMTKRGYAPVQPPTVASAPPPDDDPEWRDVPAERANWESRRKGDRWWAADSGPWEIAASDGTGSHGPRDCWIKRHDHPARKSETVDVEGRELRVGDRVLGWVRESGSLAAYPHDYVARELGVTWDATTLYRVRLPRPTVEPSAKAKCPTCRCKIVPGAECSCCVSTSGDDPPLPSLDLDDAEPSADEDTKRRDPGCECVLEEGDSDCPVHPSDPETGEPIGDWHRSSASGEGIARFERARLFISDNEWTLTDLQSHPPTSWVPHIVNAVNDATRELRERCERAEAEAVRREIERDEAQRFVGVPPGPVPWCPECGPEPCCDEVGMCSECGATVGMVPDWRALKNDCDAAVKRADLAERVVEAARDCRAQFSAPIHRHAEEHALSDALNVYDAARKDGGK